MRTKTTRYRSDAEEANRRRDGSSLLTYGNIKLKLKHTLTDPCVGLLSYLYDIEDVHTGVVCGNASLRLGYSAPVAYYGNIGYTVFPEYRGRRIAYCASRLMSGIAAERGLKSLIITCNPDNHPSRKTCERLGAKLLGAVDVPPDCGLFALGEKRKLVFLLSLTGAEPGLGGS